MMLLQGFLREGKLTPVIDRTFPLEAVPDAIRYMVQGGGLGRIVIAV
jgi:NADPH:quinone reductase-like Zn-dependent oxidoreductase